VTSAAIVGISATADEELEQKLNQIVTVNISDVIPHSLSVEREHPFESNPPLDWRVESDNTVCNEVISTVIPCRDEHHPLDVILHNPLGVIEHNPLGVFEHNPLGLIVHHPVSQCSEILTKNILYPVTNHRSPIIEGCLGPAASSPVSDVDHLLQTMDTQCQTNSVRIVPLTEEHCPGRGQISKKNTRELLQSMSTQKVNVTISKDNNCAEPLIETCSSSLNEKKSPEKANGGVTSGVCKRHSFCVSNGPSRATSCDFSNIRNCLLYPKFLTFGRRSRSLSRLLTPSARNCYL